MSVLVFRVLLLTKKAVMAAMTASATAGQIMIAGQQPGGIWIERVGTWYATYVGSYLMPAPPHVGYEIL